MEELRVGKPAAVVTFVVQYLDCAKASTLLRCVDYSCERGFLNIALLLYGMNCIIPKVSTFLVERTIRSRERFVFVWGGENYCALDLFLLLFTTWNRDSTL